MESTTENYVGCDIGSGYIDCVWFEEGKFHHAKFANTRIGFKELIARCGKASHYVMESTGPYYVGFALHLHKEGIKVSVENAVVIKRFIQMHLEKNKSDKKDARWIYEYARQQKPDLWQAPKNHILKAKQMLTLILQLTRQRTASINGLKSLLTMPVMSKESHSVYVNMIRQFDKAISKLELKLENLLKSYEGKKLENLQSIPGIGKRTVALMIIATDGFRKVDNYRQLSSWAGLSPREYSSGKTIRGKTRITKLGGKELRNSLYMCSLSAIKKNQSCKELYDRLKAKGKNGKLALIAVSNKLIKQCVAIAKSDSKYVENYLGKKACA